MLCSEQTVRRNDLESTYDVMEQIALDKPAFDAEAHKHVTAREEGCENDDGDGGEVRLAMIASLGI